jgi:GNAT superfamily N-acetyltransferase
MPEIEIRPAVSSDIPHLTALDNTYASDYTWQMEMSAEASRIGVNFRQIHLPRTVKVEYPRSPTELPDEWTRLGGLLVALLQGECIGYIGLRIDLAPATTWVRDLVVGRHMRRQGIGSTLVLAAEEWGFQHASRRILLEMQPKNYPASQLAQKLGFEFCGFNDRYYTNHDIALFFAKSLR